MSHRLHVTGRVLSFQRGKRTIHPNFSLLQINGVTSTHAARYYLGKVVYFVYKVNKKRTCKTGIKAIKGKITKTHGNSGVVRARFTHNLPARSFGKKVRVMLYPQH